MDIIESIHELDQACTLYINSLNAPWSDQIWQFFSYQEAWYPFYLILLVFVFKRLGWKRGALTLIALGLSLVICDQFSGLVKYSVSRLRPAYDTHMLQGGLHVLERRGGLFGFFSSHAANAFGMAACSLLCFRNDKSHTYNAYVIWIFVWAALVSISRVFVGKHYLGDILVGAIVGTLIGLLIGMLTNKVMNLLPERQ